MRPCVRVEEGTDGREPTWDGRVAARDVGTEKQIRRGGQTRRETQTRCTLCVTWYGGMERHDASRRCGSLLIPGTRGGRRSGSLPEVQGFLLLIALLSVRLAVRLVIGGTLSSEREATPGDGCTHTPENTIYNRLYHIRHDEYLPVSSKSEKPPHA